MNSTNKERQGNKFLSFSSYPGNRFLMEVLWVDYGVRMKLGDPYCLTIVGSIFSSVSIELINENPNEGSACKFKRTILLVVVN